MLAGKVRRLPALSEGVVVWLQLTWKNHMGRYSNVTIPSSCSSPTITFIWAGGHNVLNLPRWADVLQTMAWPASCWSSATGAGDLSKDNGMLAVILLLSYRARVLACPWHVQSPACAVADAVQNPRASSIAVT